MINVCVLKNVKALQSSPDEHYCYTCNDKVENF